MRKPGTSAKRRMPSMSEAPRKNVHKATAQARRGIRRAGARVYPRLEASYAAADRARDFEGYLEKLIEERPDDVEARLALARARAARGASEEAI